ncbi:MAG: DUF916 domain-containing protein [Candidatus Eremiobacteraeota bacterium]|nr:DUF916 domain-containing protein [Candidatus Eremiobacteraeota bacterium]
MRKQVILGLVAAMLVVTAYPTPADLGLDVAPAKYELQVAGGQSKTIPITVRNSSTAPVHIQATLSDFTVVSNGDYAFMRPGKNKYSLARWVTVNPREFDLPANGFQQVRFSINVPHGATGEYSAIVFFQTRATRRPGGVSFSERIASKLYEIIPETMHLGGEVRDLTVKTNGAGEHFIVGFQNTGNTHLYLNGRIEIKRGSEIVQRVMFPPQMLVERGGSRSIQVYAQHLPPGQYSAVALIDYGGPALTAGQTSFSIK